MWSRSPPQGPTAPRVLHFVATLWLETSSSERPLGECNKQCVEACELLHTWHLKMPSCARGCCSLFVLFLLVRMSPLWFTQWQRRLGGCICTRQGSSGTSQVRWLVHARRLGACVVVLRICVHPCLRVLSMDAAAGTTPGPATYGCPGEIVASAVRKSAAGFVFGTSTRND